DNSDFGSDEHRQFVVVKDASHKEADQFRHRSFPYYDQLTTIYAKDRATGKDAQIVVDIIEKIDAEDVHNHNHLETKMIPHFQRKKKIFDASEHISSTSFTDVAMLLAKNIQIVGLEISRSIASEVLIQQK
ncbi:hypothetical protein Gotri_004150, partial [Gossypium trilobum]|nr:hypothetical protein [Gossypium trilobum]